MALNLPLLPTPGKVPQHSDDRPEGDLAQFTLFPDLPFELRLQIWEHAACEPRNWQLHMQPRDQLNAYWHFHFHVMGFCQVGPMHHLASPLSATCRASRKAFLRASREVHFADLSGEPFRPGGKLLGLVWYPVLGLTVMDRWFDMSSLPAVVGTGQIRHLALDFNRARDVLFNLGTPSHFCPGVGWLPTHFPHLKTWQIYAEWIEPSARQTMDPVEVWNFSIPILKDFAAWIERLDPDAGGIGGYRRGGPGIVLVPTDYTYSSACWLLLLQFTALCRDYRRRRVPGQKLLFGSPIFGVEWTQ
ncbi:hypothetical protein PG993_010872 [Apiospora rasikravindrae]|uniref:2EXR domain-containing protein n=1 Tax=Apiospora rasikravindrae TaxID=990691 RepID=A0ABR1SCX5_9PEZI